MQSPDLKRLGRALHIHKRERKFGTDMVSLMLFVLIFVRSGNYKFVWVKKQIWGYMKVTLHFVSS